MPRFGSHCFRATRALSALLSLACACSGARSGADSASVEAPRSAPAEAATAPGAADPRLRCEGCNVIYVSLDTLRADRLGVYGYPRDTSPRIDELARDSLVFTDVLAQAPSTAASHRSMFSSRYVHEHRNMLWMPVVASVMRSQGYRTQAFVDGGRMRRQFGLDKGFERYESTDAVHQQGAQVGGGLEEINPQVTAWLDAHREEQFFLFVHTYDAHCPYTPPEPWATMFTSAHYLPSFEMEMHCGIYFNTLELTTDDFGYIGDRYDGGVRYMDHELGELLDHVRVLGLLDDTIVVLTSDHGEALGERDRVGHNQVYDVQLKVPLIVHLPSRMHGVFDAPVESNDLMPTLLSALGQPHPEHLSGRDLIDAIEHDRWDRQRLRLAHDNRGRFATVREGTRWSLITDGRDAVELYDLHADATEEHDVYDQHPEVVTRLHDAFLARRAASRRLRSRPRQVDDRLERELRALGYAGQ